LSRGRFDAEQIGKGEAAHCQTADLKKRPARQAVAEAFPPRESRAHFLRRHFIERVVERCPILFSNKSPVHRNTIA